MNQKHLSTTALAKRLHKEARELFVLLADGAWIVKVDNRWHLTEKGKFEGGIYIEHPKYGEYIAWPETIQQHAIWGGLPEAPLTATTLGQKFNQPARFVNHLLAELGWIHKAVKGWHLSEQGKALGGQQKESDKTGIPFVTWPETLLDHPALKEDINALKSMPAALEHCALDGHILASDAERLIDNWLYLAGIPHSVNRRLPVAEVYRANFYLPSCNVFLEFWGGSQDAGAIKRKLERAEVYKRNQLALIEIEESELGALDEILARRLLKFGVAVY